MDKIDIDRKIAERADEFAEREYVCGAEERAHLSKGYYWGYKDAEKDLELTREDIEIIRKIIEDLDFSNKSEGMDVITFNGTVARRFNSYRRKKK